MLTLAPGHVGALRNLGNSLAALDRHEEAVEVYRRALGAMPGDAGLLSSLGASLSGLERADEAIEVLRAATAAAPHDPDAWLNLGVACHQDGRTDDAIDAYQRSLALRPSHADAWHSLGRALLAARRRDEGIDAYRRALADLDAMNGPADARVRVLCDLGAELHGAGQSVDAIALFRTAMQAGPDDADAWRNLGVTLSAIGDQEGAAGALGRAVELGSVSPDTHSKQIFVLDLLPTTTPEQAFAVRRAWNEAHALPLASLIRPHTNTPDPERRLRVGYVSADFCRHSAATTLPDGRRDARSGRRRDRLLRREPPGGRLHRAVPGARCLLAADGRSLGRGAGRRRSAPTRSTSWWTSRRTPAATACSTFARKPAPVQVTAWGYATGTGLDAMDAFFADPIVVRPDEHRWYAEEVVNLPSVLCYAPPPASPPIAPLPALTPGARHLRLVQPADQDHLGRARDLGPDPAGRPGLAAPAEARPARTRRDRARLLDPLARLGVDPRADRDAGAECPPPASGSFGELDMQLDPFPQGGGVTTVEGLLMGVPCVTLLGERVPGRVSASFSQPLGLDDLVAQTEDEYVEIAVRLAQDVDRLRHERETLRERLLASPMGNAALYTRAVEDAYRTLWRRWCDLGPPVGERIAPLHRRR